MWKTFVIVLILLSVFFILMFTKFHDDENFEHLQLFQTYVDQYNKSYKSHPSQYNERFKHFKESLRKIHSMNSLRTCEESARYGLTEYSDMSSEEFLTLVLQQGFTNRDENYMKEPKHRLRSHHNRIERSSTVIPMQFDWREKGVVTPVRFQGTCGACWAFSSIEVVESMFAIKNGSLQSFSVQEMIDCAGYSNFGCEGGDTCSLLMWLTVSKTNILPEINYPLTRATGACQLTKDNTKISGTRVTKFSCDRFVDAEDDLLKLIATHGPVAAAVNALSWQNYLGGTIEYNCGGSFDDLNHAVQIIGYNKLAPIPYYIIKNSWGTVFGDKGYIYIAIGNNLCGIANEVASLDVI